MRTGEILGAVDTLIQVHDEWENDPQAPDVPSEKLEAAIEDVIAIVDSGDIPETCRELTTAIGRVSIEWEKYREGIERLPDGRPVGRFWGAMAAVFEARKGASPFIPKRPEPVSELLRQNVSHRQIALHIYGDGKTGPFVDKSGQPDIRLINQESAKPGSVIPDDWVHPRELELLRKYEETSRRQLQAIHDRQNEGDGVDPATIEELLREGAYPAQVARAKRVPIQDVLAVMHRLAAEGVHVNADLPNLAAMRSPYEPPITAAQDRALQPGQNTAAGGLGSASDSSSDAEESDEEVESVATARDAAAVDQLIMEIHQQNPDFGAGEIVAAMRETLGENVTVQKVTKVLRKAKSAASETVGV